MFSIELFKLSRYRYLLELLQRSFYFFATYKGIGSLFSLRELISEKVSNYSEGREMEKNYVPLMAGKAVLTSGRKRIPE